jgi:hypothetical protein
MAYGRLFSPGMDAGGGAHPMVPAYAGKNAYKRAMDRGLGTNARTAFGGVFSSFLPGINSSIPAEGKGCIFLRGASFLDVSVMRRG